MILSHYVKMLHVKNVSFQISPIISAERVFVLSEKGCYMVCRNCKKHHFFRRSKKYNKMIYHLKSRNWLDLAVAEIKGH